METTKYIIEDEECVFLDAYATVYKSGISEVKNVPGALYGFIMDFTLKFECLRDGMSTYLEYEACTPITYTDRDFGRDRDSEEIAERLISGAEEELKYADLHTQEIVDSLHSLKSSIQKDIQKYIDRED